MSTNRRAERIFELSQILESLMPERYMLSITLSEKAYEEFRLVATWKRIPIGTLIRQILEREHESQAFGELVKRASADGQTNASED
ncbi:hypothetical protein GNF10_21245 [Nostoc sp. UCD121]|nr:hypothetical protein [Nostoc sp. UCD121]MBC1222715.1 hypothetical protein [Nostoc sp. UCD120]MBC1278420.1 hypothetical protein [Nostoc sp. UCD121]MBC1295169.1 hypothetical protein [Nostoc sp. UCD122]